MVPLWKKGERLKSVPPDRKCHPEQTPKTDSDLRRENWLDCRKGRWPSARGSESLKIRAVWPKGTHEAQETSRDLRERVGHGGAVRGGTKQRRKFRSCKAEDSASPQNILDAKRSPRRLKENSPAESFPRIRKTTPLKSRNHRPGKQNCAQ